MEVARATRRGARHVDQVVAVELPVHVLVTGGKIISSHTGPGTNRAAQALRWATQSLYRSPSSLGQHFRRMRARLGTPEAITATAHKLARIIYHLITERVAYDDSVLAAQER